MVEIVLNELQLDKVGEKDYPIKSLVSEILLNHYLGGGFFIGSFRKFG